MAFDSTSGLPHMNSNIASAHSESIMYPQIEVESKAALPPFLPDAWIPQGEPRKYPGRILISKNDPHVRRVGNIIKITI